jgi:hypothetical protein
MSKNQKNGIKMLDPNQVEENYRIAQYHGAKQIINIIFERKDLYAKLKKLAGESGLIEIGHVYGSDDEGNGYYKFHLMLNINHIENKYSDKNYDSFDDIERRPILYLVCLYVPSPDNGYDWQEKTISEISQLNFHKAQILLEYLNIFLYYSACLKELVRLSERSFNTCVKTVESGGLSFM